MAAEALVQVNGQHHLVAVTAAEQEILSGLSKEQTYRAKLTAIKPRSWRQLKFYWATLDEAVDHQEFYIVSKPLHFWLKTRCGLYDKVSFHDGGVHVELNSIGIEKMEPAPFNEYFDQVLFLLCTEICPGMEQKALLRTVEQKTGIAYVSLKSGEA